MSAPAALLLLSLAAAPQKLAVPEWKTVNMPAELGGFYAGEFARAMRDQGFEVVTAADIRALLGFERQRQLLGCEEAAASCMAELGAALGCEAIVVADLARLDDTYRGSVRVLSATSGRTLATAPVRASGQRALADALESAAEGLARQLRPPPPGSGPSRGLAWLPLALGVGLGGGAAACFAVAGDAYTRIPSLGEPEALRAAADGRTLQVVGWALAGTGAAALVTAGVVAFTGRPPTVAPQVSVGAGGASIGLVGVLP